MARHTTTLSSEFLLSASAKLLTETGNLHIVLPVTDGNAFMETAKDFGLFCKRILRIKPTPSQPPKRVLMSFGHEDVCPEESSLVIEKGERHDYSDEYKYLTRDFYLDK